MLLIDSKSYAFQIRDGGMYHLIPIQNQYWFVKIPPNDKTVFGRRGLMIHRINGPAIISSLFGEQFKYENGKEIL